MRSVQITYVGNEGILVTAPEGKVLIDALFADGATHFADTPPQVIEAVEMASPPFDGVDVVLATHVHPDHFNPGAVGRHLTHNHRARFLSTRQSATRLRDECAEVADRIQWSVPGACLRESFEFGAIEVETVSLSHGRVNYGDVEHLGFLVRLGAVNIVHVGDAIIDQRTLRVCEFFGEPIAAAFLPFWYLTYPFGRRLVRKQLKPRRVFVMHVPLNERPRISREISEVWPEALVLTAPLETHELG